MSSAFATAALIKANVTYLDIVAAAVLMYDYLLTVEREARLVWPVPWNFGKALFFTTRYPVFAETFMVLYHQFAVLSPGECTGLYRAIGFGLGIGTLVAESILAVRTWVIWHRDRRIGYALVAALVLFWTPVFYFLKVALYSLVFTTPPHPNTPGCFLSKQSRNLWVVFVIIMVFETLILGLTMLKGFEHFRGTNSTLVSVLYRDGILNYIYLCILSIINVTVLLTAPHGYSTLLTALQRALHSILSSRILLHLREAAVVRNKGVTSTSTSSYRPPGHVTSEMGGFSIGRSRPTAGKPSRYGTNTGVDWEFSNKGQASTMGELEDYGYGGESLAYDRSTGPVDADGTSERALVQKKATDEEVGPEELFGEKEEGLKPETVTWFGETEESRRQREDIEFMSLDR